MPHGTIGLVNLFIGLSCVRRQFVEYIGAAQSFRKGTQKKATSTTRGSSQTSTLLAHDDERDLCSAQI